MIVTYGGLDAFLHTLVVGPTGSGKTSYLLSPMAMQILESYKRGNRVGMLILEPSGDFVEDIYQGCLAYGIPVRRIDPTWDGSDGLNPLLGEPQVVAEMTRTVLKRLFGKQEAFFALVQEMAARNAVLLLKRLYGDDADLLHIVRALRNLKTLKEHITEYERKHRRDDLVEFFQVEVFDSENFTKISTGLRMQLEDLVGNELVLKLLTKKKEESVRFEEHLANGGVVLINSALGELGNLSSIFGQFAIMTFQNAVFRRPGNQWTRRPHYTFIDELPEYLNPDFRRLLTLGRKYRNACTIAIQNISQLKVDGYPGLEDTIMTNCRNKLIFACEHEADAKKFSALFGTEKRVNQTKIYDTHMGMKAFTADKVTQTEKEVPRFTPTQLMELPAYHFVARLVKNGQLQVPKLVKGQLVRIPEGKEEESNRKPFAWIEKVTRKRKEEMIARDSPSESEEAKASVSQEGGDQPRKKITIVFPEQSNLSGEEKWFTLRKAKRKTG